MLKKLLYGGALFGIGRSLLGKGKQVRGRRNANSISRMFR